MFGERRNMDVDLLISKVFANNAIWNRCNRLHSNRVHVEKCWKEISDSMNLDVDVLKKKWKYLRDQFSVELGKSLLQLGDSSESCSTSKWPYFKSLYFLKDVVKARASSGNLAQNCSHSESQKHHSDSIVDDSELDMTGHIQENSSDEILENDDALETLSNASSQESVPTLKRQRLLQNDTFNKALLSIEKQNLQYFQHKRIKKQKEEDEDEMFFKSLLPHVKRIESQRKMAFRIKIEQIVDEFAYHSNLTTNQS